ncbi:sodium channel modifier 1 [Falco biarmicus]|uniref:sodium channel modifier 1 n=1 Tax=Falco biarmicus TaxID=345155 RepID=UPI0024BC38B0|nr:sodium channel modifier 1 [Falco biarmicus]
MSFKREGDDPGQLGVLQVRLHSVCPRPVFDTLDVLTVHRAGKKHMGSLQRFYSRKRSLQDAAQKRRHEEELQAEEAGTQGSPAPSSGTDEEDCPERSAQSSSLQQLLPEDGGGGKQLTSWCHPDGAECCPDAARAVAEERSSPGRQPCSPCCRGTAAGEWVPRRQLRRGRSKAAKEKPHHQSRARLKPSAPRGARPWSDTCSCAVPAGSKTALASG